MPRWVGPQMHKTRNLVRAIPHRTVNWMLDCTRYVHSWIRNHTAHLKVSSNKSYSIFVVGVFVCLQCGPAFLLSQFKMVDIEIKAKSKLNTYHTYLLVSTKVQTLPHLSECIFAHSWALLLKEPVTVRPNHRVRYSITIKGLY